MSSNPLDEAASESGGLLSGLGSGSLDTLKEFARNPRSYILGVVAVWVVEQVLRATGAVLASLGQSIQLLADVPRIVVDAGGLLGRSIFDATAMLLDAYLVAVVTVATELGLVGPILAGIILLGTAIALEFLARWAIRLVGNYVGLT